MKLPAIRKKDRSFKPNTEVKYDPYEMDEQVAEMIEKYISQGAVKNDINKMFPMFPKLWDSYQNYIKWKNQEAWNKDRAEATKKLNEKIDDMDDFKNFGLGLTKGGGYAGRGRKKAKDDDPYKWIYDFLDSKIEIIENLIYLGVSPKRICAALIKQFQDSQEMSKLTPIIYHQWKDYTKHVQRLIFAYKCSGEEHMNLSKEFMMEWLDINLHPELDMQHVGIIREIGLWHSRMAEFQDRKKYGKVLKIEDERPQSKTIAGRDLREFLEGIQKRHDVINGEDESESGGEESDEESSDSGEEFTEFEEM